LLAEDSQIFSILIWYVENGPVATAIADSSDEKRVLDQLLTVDKLIERGVSIRGHYADRGLAIETLGAVLWESQSLLEEGKRVIQNCIDTEEIESIRCSLTHAIYSVLRHDNPGAATLLKNLVVRTEPPDILPLLTYQGFQLLFYILHGTPDIGSQLLDFLLSAQEEDHSLVGALHLFREAFYDKVYEDRADLLINQSDSYRKVAAYVAAHHLSNAAYSTRAKRQLTSFFNDPEKDVRNKAAECFRTVWKEPIDNYRDLIRYFIQSKAFEDDGFSLFHLLEESHESATEEVVLAAERLLDLADQPDDPQVFHNRGVHYLDDLLLREYTATIDRPILRRRILDIIDRMLILGLYGTLLQGYLSFFVQ
jgi:hypothetical protein